MSPRVVGLDLSLLSTGLAVFDANGDLSVARIRPKGKGFDRLNYIQREIRRWCAGADLVVVEDPAWGVKNSKTYHQLAGGWWCSTLAAWEVVGDRLAHINIAQIKQYATGSPSAEKALVLAAAIKRFPDTEFRSDDESDATWAAAAGRRWLGAPVDSVPKANHVALAKVEWPDITPEGEPTQ